jgi:hypothetical protein
VPSRCGLRLSPIALISRSTSCGVRCSRVRKARLVARRGTVRFILGGETSFRCDLTTVLPHNQLRQSYKWLFLEQFQEGNSVYFHRFNEKFQLQVGLTINAASYSFFCLRCFGWSGIIRANPDYELELKPITQGNKHFLVLFYEGRPTHLYWQLSSVEIKGRLSRGGYIPADVENWYVIGSNGKRLSASLC